MFKFNNIVDTLPAEGEVLLVKAYGKDRSIVHAVVYWDGNLFWDAAAGKFYFRFEDVVGWLPISIFDGIEVKKSRSKK